MFKGYTQWHSHISCRLTSSYGHTSMAVRLIYAEALEVGHLGRGEYSIMKMAMASQISH